MSDTQLVGAPPLLDGAHLNPCPIGGPDAYWNGGALDAVAEGADAVGRCGAVAATDIEIHVVSGPGAGATQALTEPTVIGRSHLADVQVPDPSLSRLHLSLEPVAHGTLVRDLESSNGTTTASLDVEQGSFRAVDAVGVVIGPDDLIGAGATTLAVRHRTACGISLAPTGQGTLAVHRRPRAALPEPPPGEEVPPAPTPAPPARLNLLMLVLPLLVCVVVAAVLHSPLFLLFGLLSPVLMLSQWNGDRRARFRDHRAALAQHAATLERLENELARRAREELWHRRRRAPDPAWVATVAHYRLESLWERRRDDPDALTLRVGTGEVAADAHVRAGVRVHRPVLPEAPIELDLRPRGCVGICGPRQIALAISASIVGQLATWNSPADLRICVLAAGATRRRAWRWVELLPHTRGAGSFDIEVVDVNATDAAAVAALLTDLAATGSTGTAGAAGAGGAAASHDARSASCAGRHTVVVVDGSVPLRHFPSLAKVLADDPATRRHVLCLGETATALPVECETVIEASTDRTDRAVLWEAGGQGGGASTTFIPDLPDARWRRRIGAAMAPLRDTTALGSESPLPADVALVDLLGIDATDADAVLGAWRAHPRSTRAPIGIGVTGTHHLDLRRDGPHVLVGGMTGSGKSELLRSLITGLAVGNRPDELGFVLIDYKGGSAFDGCARLPHVLGLVTDLEGSLTSRALISLRVELRRREALLRAAGVDDLERYAAAREVDPRLLPLPRLIIVVDEFRALAEEQPDFVTGLVQVAAQGRSLGVHLVLATQRPAGVVSAEIRANTNLRIAMRVRDSVDSHDLIDTGEAALLPATSPGRALLRVGGSDPVTVQIARTNAPARELRQCPQVTLFGAEMPTDSALSPDNGGSPRPAPGDPRADTSPPAALVAALVEAAQRLGWHPPGHPDSRVHRPWLPELPARIDLDDLPAATDESGSDALHAPDARAPLRAPGTSTMSLARSCRHADLGSIRYGLLDDPEHQAQPAATWAARGNLGVIGAAGSGRTTALRTLALSGAAQTCPGRLQLYVIDAGSGLAQLGRLPHTGAVVAVTDQLRLRALIARLGAELRRRERGSAATAQPRVLLLIDGWERVRETLESLERGAPLEELLDLLRHGPSSGIQVIVAGGRTLLLGALPGLLTDKLVLRLAEPADAVLAGLPSAASAPSRTGHPTPLATQDPPGRGRRLPDRRRVQVATCRNAHLVTGTGDPSVPEIPVEPPPDNNSGRPFDPSRWSGRHPMGVPLACGSAAFHLDPLPTRISLIEVTTAALAGGLDTYAAPDTVWIGQGLEGPVGLPISQGALICGPRRSGRTSALCTIASGLGLLRRPWVAVTDAPHRFDAITPGRAISVGDSIALRAALARATEGLVLLIDDVDQVFDTAFEHELEALLRQRDHPPVVVAGEARAIVARYRGLVTQLRALPAAVVLQPSPADRDLFGVALPDVSPGTPVGSAPALPGRAVVLTGALVRAAHLALVPTTPSDAPAPARGHPDPLTVLRHPR